MDLWNPFLAMIIGNWQQSNNSCVGISVFVLGGIYGLSVGYQFVVIVKPLKLQVAGSTAVINDPHLRILRQA